MDSTVRERPKPNGDTEMNTNFISKDQNWGDETTTYWYEVDGVSKNTDALFENEVYGIVMSADDVIGIVNEDNYPLVEGDNDYIAISSIAISEEVKMG